MTPAEVKILRDKVTQENVDEAAQYLEHWFSKTVQPQKGFLNMVNEMKKERTPPYQQMKHILGAAFDWFAYGN